MCSTCVGEALNSLVSLDARTICNNFGLDLDVEPSPVHLQFMAAVGTRVLVRCVLLTSLGKECTSRDFRINYGVK